MFPRNYSALNWQIAVSYTHLDVYKRQVALGRYAKTQNSFSFREKPVPTRQNNTPMLLKISARKIMIKTETPALNVYRISTAAPTRTKSISSAASHNFPNFCESLLDTKGVLLAFNIDAMLIMASKPE